MSCAGCRNLRRRSDDPLGDFKTHIGVFGDASVIVRDRHHRHVVSCQRQHQFQPLFLRLFTENSGADGPSHASNPLPMRQEIRAVDTRSEYRRRFAKRGSVLAHIGSDKVIVGIARNLPAIFIRERKPEVHVRMFAPAGPVRWRSASTRAEIAPRSNLRREFAGRWVDYVPRCTQKGSSKR